MKNSIIFTCIAEERQKVLRLQELLLTKNKSPEEIQEQNQLVDEKFEADEMANEPHIKDIIDGLIESANYFSIKEVDFMIGIIYGMMVQRISEKNHSEDDKKLVIKILLRISFQIRQLLIEQIQNNKKSSTETLKPKTK